MFEVNVCAAAVRDYAESLIWYAKQSVDAADRFDAAVDHAMAMIAADPERYPKCDDRHRFFLLQDFPFQIVYRCLGREICVIAIAHASRDPGYWKGR